MSVHLTSFCLLFLCLQVRDSSSVEALKHYGVYGENILIPFAFHSSGPLKTFCRETCEGENLVIRTNNNTAQRGRYKVEDVRGASTTFSVLSVSISGLTWSDSGRYRCGLGDSSSSASFQDFRLVVVDALLDGNKDHHLHKEAGSSLAVACYFRDSGAKRLFCRGGCGADEVLVQTRGVRADSGRYSIEYDKRPKSGAVLLVTITQLIQSDSGRYRCKMDRTIRSDLYSDFSITVADADAPSTSTPTTQSFSSSSTDPTSTSTPTTTQSFSSSSMNDPSSSTPTTQSFSSSSRSFPRPTCFKISNDSVQVQDNRVTFILNVPLIAGVTVMVVLFSAALLVSCRRRPQRGAENRGSSSGSNFEKTIYENFTFEDSTYQDLSPATRDQDHIYCELRELE